MKIVYVAGPYRAATIAGVKANIQTAVNVQTALVANGVMAYCPHANTAFMDGLQPDQFFLEFGLEMVARCDAVVIYLGYSQSPGTMKEVELARQLNKPIFLWTNHYDDKRRILEWAKQ